MEQNCDTPVLSQTKNTPILKILSGVRIGYRRGTCGPPGCSGVTPTPAVLFNFNTAKGRIYDGKENGILFSVISFHITTILHRKTLKCDIEIMTQLRRSWLHV